MSESGSSGPPRRSKHLMTIVVASAVVLCVVIFAATRPAPTPATGNAPGEQSSAPPHLNESKGDPKTSAAPSANVPSNAPAPKKSGAATTPDQVKSPAAAPSPKVNPNDLPPGHPVIATDDKTRVSLQWFGHSCFYIYTPGGKAVVTDPFDPKVTGLPAAGTGAHLVTISTNDPEHDYPAAVHPFRGEDLQVIHDGEKRVGDLHVKAVPLNRDSAGGSREGKTNAYVIEAGTIRIAHLGDVGGPLSDAQVKALGRIDILLVPVGGEGLGPREAVAVVKQVNPKIVIPMAYRMPDAAPMAKLRTVEDFVAASPFARTEISSDVVMISKPELPESTEIYTLRR
jgi:L-ascorbate metabolism protein UlaG (beta-lactamase superfamily)